MRVRFPALVLASCLLAFASQAFAAADGSTLQLPKGADVAVVIFEDLQCPDCARVHPLLMEATKTSKVPLVIHDFPITRHSWAFPAAVLARYFGTVSPDLEIAFRTHIFSHQKDVNPENLRGIAEQFARDHKLQLPAQVDPDDRIKARVQADYDYGQDIGLEYVPLVFVIATGSPTVRWVEVQEQDVEKIGATIDAIRKAMRP